MSTAASDPHAGQPVTTLGAPLGEGRGVVIMVHGRGAGPDNILDLVPSFELEDLTYLAPAAANRTWYPYSFMSPVEQNEPFLSSALARLGFLIGEVEAAGVPANRIVLLGFSQGACLSGEFAYRHARRFGGVVMFSGGLIGPAGTRWDSQRSFEGTPIFLGCSDRDAHIPRARVDESAEVFAGMQANVTKRIYEGMGHLVCQDEVDFAKQLLTAL